MKKLFFMALVLILASCTNSEKVNGTYNGNLTHNGNPSISAEVSLTENGNNFVYLTVSSSVGNFVQSLVKVTPQNSYYNLSIETSLPASVPNEIISITGYSDPQGSKEIHFSYTIDLDGIPGGTTIDGSFAGTKN